MSLSAALDAEQARPKSGKQLATDRWLDSLDDADRVRADAALRDPVWSANRLARAIHGEPGAPCEGAIRKWRDRNL